MEHSDPNKYWLEIIDVQNFHTLEGSSSELIIFPESESERQGYG
jgi:hypothetical protein